jgi:signal transduction histidine kinase/ActR/RegA family two-component response regulator
MLHPHADLLTFFSVVLLVSGLLAVALRRTHVSHTATVVMLSVSVVTCLLGHSMAHHAEENEAQRMKSVMIGFAPSYALAMQELGHSQIHLDTPPDDPTYLRLINAQIERLRINRVVADIYTLRKDAQGQFRLIVDAETDYDQSGRIDTEREQRTPIGEVYEAEPFFNEAFNGKVVFSDRPYTDQWGTWVTAVAPIFNSDNSVDAVIGLDFPAQQWAGNLANARQLAVWKVAAVLVANWGVYVAWAQVGMVLANRKRTELALANMNRSTERARLAAEQAREAADSANRAKSNFLANMSHEIRTPMTAILGFADVLNDPLIDAGQKQEAIDSISRNGQHLLGIINDILDFSKIEAGKMTVESIDVNPREVLANVQRILAGRAAAKNLVFATRSVGMVPATIKCDPTRLTQILVNLAGNAIKFTARGSVRIESRFENNALRFDVIDSGIGMTREQMSRLFKPFEQADSSTTRQFGGTGLGLSISHRLAELLSGTLSVTSVPGSGSTFTLKLDLASQNLTLVNAVEPDPVVAVKPTQAYCAVPLMGRHILVADDGEDNRRLLSFHLKRSGASFVCVEDGQQAVDAVRAAQKSVRPFDVVIMDVQMPALSGLEATQLLRSEGYTLPIVALTANAMDSDRLNCLAAGCSAYASKPLNPSMLIELLGDLTEDGVAKAA